MASSNALVRARYKYFPDHLVGELLSKRWMESAVPTIILAAVFLYLVNTLPNYLSPINLMDLGRLYAEFGLVVLAMALVMIGGGVDLSIGSMFALCNVAMLSLINMLEWPLWIAIPSVLIFGAALGAINGYLIGYLKLRAFLTTLVTLIIYRALFDIALSNFAVEISGGFLDSEVWEFIGDGDVFGIPSSLIAFLVVAIGGHLVMSRTRPGWHILAIGGARRSAYNAGVAVNRTIFMTYVVSGILTALAAVFFAARLGTAGSDVGVGMEVAILTAAVLGGISLGGGRGSVAKATMGSAIVLLITNGMLRMGMEGGSSSVALGVILLIAVGIDVKWLKNRHKIISKVYVSPAYLELVPAPSAEKNSGTVYEVNDRLKTVTAIGLGNIEGPEDVILDHQDNLFTGTRHGDIVKFSGPNYEKQEVFAHIGGHPLGMAFDPDGNLLSCVGGMGLYGIKPSGEVYRLTDQTNRTWHSINDDSRLRLADDCDVTPDGEVYFSEATIRYEMHSWSLDSLEGRGNGRIICYDLNTKKTRTVIRNLLFPNGICTAFDGKSILFAETWKCAISRYWIDGPKRGKVEPVIPNLPGYPDNINRASDGNYWLALVGMRTPTFDLAMKMPSFRRRMARRVAPDEWLFPNINSGCVLKFNEAGEILDVYWDLGGESHPMITSMREHKGHLYLGGLSNNRIGRYKLDNADPDWVGIDTYWGKSK
ncbi:SMP-30/gluconolactonase/LRE family protein [Sneathiella sp.]|uniref:ABC transporter permease n=1 Tax=Sneathiella sp. TaxID=1964365 RepID=UPI00260D355C|nr:SMP-30/gluconolactonase/LRE family protein [Sneathiella sp.]MDF2367968.1 SMP-30/gluconolactonase/LRE family protein [Sneathiella sp.]